MRKTTKTLVTHRSVAIKELRSGDIIRFGDDEPWVEVLKAERDRFGWDVLYAPWNGEPH